MTIKKIKIKNKKDENKYIHVEKVERMISAASKNAQCMFSCSCADAYN